MSPTTSTAKLLSNEASNSERPASPVALARRPETAPDAVALASPAKLDVSTFQPGELWSYGIDAWQR